ncbi:MAG: HepT-like ribonuclease domain-containing protein [Promethearchaeota archaeon]
MNRYINDLSYEQFQKDVKTVDAVIKNLEIIGEAAKKSSNITQNEKQFLIVYKLFMRIPR